MINIHNLLISKGTAQLITLHLLQFIKLQAQACRICRLQKPLTLIQTSAPVPIHQHTTAFIHRQLFMRQKRCHSQRCIRRWQSKLHFQLFLLAAFLMLQLLLKLLGNLVT